MKSAVVSLKFAENVKEFVNTVNKFDYDVDLRSGRFVIDAKSILGIFSLDLSRPITMEIHSDNCADLLGALKNFIVK